MANTDRDVAAHHLRYHSKSHPAPPSCANPSDFTAWVTRKQARLTFRDKKETCGSQDTGQDEQPSSVCQSAPAADEFVWLKTPTRVTTKQQARWCAKATGASRSIGRELQVELEFPALGVRVWRPTSVVNRTASAITSQLSRHGVDERILPGMTAGISSGSTVEILRALQGAHGHALVPDIMPKSCPEGWEPIPVGADVVVRTSTASSAVTTSSYRKGRVIQRETVLQLDRQRLRDG